MASAAPVTRTGEVQPSAVYRLGWMCLLAALIGVLAGIVAYVLYDLIALFTNIAYYHEFSLHFRSPRDSTLGPWIIIVPVVGGLLSGLLAKYGSPKIRGHGIPEAIEAVLSSRSRIEPKVALLKPLSAAICIGTGGPYGAEGPIIQTGGAFGSVIGQILSTTAAERKVMLACGACAGMAATFNTPIAGVILAIELLLFEFRARSFIPLVIASTLATSVRVLLFGQHSMFVMGATDFNVPRGLPYYVLLGVICGIAAVGVTKALTWIEEQFERLPIDEVWHPAIGMLSVGILGFFVPRILGVGYDTISDILNGNLTLKILILVAAFKFVALVVSLGSGTSGGLLAPTFMWSAALGGAFAMAVNKMIPSAHLAPGAFALVAMAAVFGSAARATFSLIVFAFEITGDYNAILPLMLGCVISDLIALRYSKNSIMTERLVKRGLSVPGDYEASVLSMVNVSAVMRQKPNSIPPDTTVAHLTKAASRHDATMNLADGVPIVGEGERLLGVITQGDVMRSLEKDPEGRTTVSEAGNDAPIVAYPDELVAQALHRMVQHGVGHLPVVSRKDDSKLIGYLDRANVLGAWSRQIEDEGLRESGWLSSWTAPHGGPGFVKRFWRKD